MIKRILVSAPSQFVTDLFDKDPEFFRHQGCVIFVGRQGTGKTIAMCQFAREMKKEYPKSKCTSNLDLTVADTEKEYTSWSLEKAS